jgi:hypothetical protein
VSARRAGLLSATVLATVAMTLGVDVEAAAPAFAAATFTSPSAGDVITSDAVVAIRARLGPVTGTTKLHLRGPDGVDRVVASGQSLAGGDTLSYDFDTSCPSYPGAAACSGPEPAADGTWTAYLSGGSSGQRTFDVRIPPAAPASVTARAGGPTVADVTWTLGAEPDLTAYDVATTNGKPIVSGAPLSQICSAGSCGVAIDFGATAAGDHDLVVVAHRSCAGCPDADLASAPSSPVTVRLTGAPASATPAPPSSSGAPPTPGSGPTTSGRSSASRSSVSAAERRRAFQAAVGTGPGASVLPPLPAADGVTRIPAPFGTYAPKLGYHVALGSAVPAPQVAAAPSLATSLRDQVGVVGGDRRLWQALAAALVLALLGLHVRRWAVTTRRR